MADIGVTTEELDRIARILRTSTDTLNSAAQHPVSDINAGRSTPAVQLSIATLARAAAGLASGAESKADEVDAACKTYVITDEEASRGMPNTSEGN